MSLTEHDQHVVYPAIFDALTVNHIKDVAPSTNIQKMIITPGGSVDPHFIAEASLEPTVKIQTGDIATILAAVSPVNGLKISTAAEIQYQKRADGGTFQGTLSHITLNSPAGFLFIESISAEQDSQDGAQLALMFYALRSGSNAPVVINTGQTLSGTVAVNELYSLGPVVYEGSKLGGVQNVAFQSGIKFTPKRAGGDTTADIGSITERQPLFEISGTNLSTVANVGFGLKGISAGTTIYYIKKGAAPTDPVHVSITIDSGTYEVQGINDGKQGDATKTLIVQGAKENPIITYSTTATLP